MRLPAGRGSESDLIVCVSVCRPAVALSTEPDYSPAFRDQTMGIDGWRWCGSRTERTYSVLGTYWGFGQRFDNKHSTVSIKV